MFRVTVLPVIVTLAAGPSAAMFCKAWCAPQAAAENGCHHQNTGTSTRVGGNDTCDDTSPRVAVISNENPLRRALPDSGGTATFAPFVVMAPVSYAPSTTDSDRALPAVARPLSTPLRL